MVYSTCSISPMENDQVVAKALASAQGRVQVCTSSAVGQSHQQHASSVHQSVLDSMPEIVQQLGAEATQHGLVVLPDQAGAGPMFVCVLQKSA